MTAAMCRSCGRHIVWASTEAGKKMPVDLEEVEGGNVRLIRKPGGFFAKVITSQNDVKAHKSHFATCPNADKHRKSR